MPSDPGWESEINEDGEVLDEGAERNDDNNPPAGVAGEDVAKDGDEKVEVADESEVETK